MFFLKELPTKTMVDKYTSDNTELDSDSILNGLTIMRQASLLVRGIENYFAEYGLSQLKFLIMIVIDREPEVTSLSPHEIATRLDVSRPVLTRALKTLLEQELLSSVDDEVDKRVKNISLTDKGHNCLEQVLPGYFALISERMNKDTI